MFIFTNFFTLLFVADATPMRYCHRATDGSTIALFGTGKRNYHRRTQTDVRVFLRACKILPRDWLYIPQL